GRLRVSPHTLGGSMGVVVPIRRIRSNLDPLIWVLRSWETNYPNIRLVLAGHRPSWANPDAVVETVQNRTKFHNIGINLVATLNSPKVGEEFVWTNDDIFLLKPMAE